MQAKESKKEEAAKEAQEAAVQREAEQAEATAAIEALEISPSAQEEKAIIGSNEKTREERAAELIALAKEWKPSEHKDDVKDPNAGYYGGF